MARIVEAIVRYRRGELDCIEAAEVLGMSERHFRRLRDRYEGQGAEGIVDRRLGKASARRVPVDRIDWVVETYRTRYSDFTVKHYHEHLVRDHRFELSYTWLKTTLQAHDAVKPAPRRSAHRKKRPRRPLPGMLLFQDGSRHRWLVGPDGDLDLIATLDDATGELYSAFLVEEEGTMSSFRGLHETISAHGLFSSFYTDRGSHYFHTPKAGGKVDKERPTQVGRALAQLGIQHIASYSPEARGRMERLFGTLQGRWPQELRIAGVEDIAAANRYIRDVLIPRHNAQFAVPAAEEGSAFVSYVGRDLADILCVHEERTVGKDNCVLYKRLSLQIPPDRHRHHYVKAKVRVHEYSDATLAVFHGPRRLARYAPDGTPIAEEPDRTRKCSAA
jgi:ribosomal protein L20